MHKLDMSNVIIQEMFHSKHAKRKYKLAPQRRPIGTIDLTRVESTRQFHSEWMEYVGRTGNFSLLARNDKRVAKCIAVMRISESGIAFKDNRCTLCVLLRIRESKKLEDMRI